MTTGVVTATMHTPTQARALAELLDPAGPRPTFDPALGPSLRDALEEGLRDAAQAIPVGQRLSVRKALLGQIHTCEGHWAAMAADAFEWSGPVARGVVAHKSLELQIGMRDVLAPLDLVDVAIQRLVAAPSDWGPRDWLLDAPPAELAELRISVADWLTKFDDTFPPLRRGWRPRIESAMTVELGDGRIHLRGKVDLALGRAIGTTARVLIVDFKSGSVRRSHIDDLRFYALLETIRVGVPPYRLATFSLDSGTWQAEDVDTDTLEATLRRVIDGVIRLTQVMFTDRTPQLTPGPACEWCPAAATCPAAAVDRDA